MTNKVKGPCLKVGHLLDSLKDLDRDMDVSIAFPILNKDDIMRFTSKTENEVESHFFGSDPSSWEFFTEGGEDEENESLVDLIKERKKDQDQDFVEFEDFLEQDKKDIELKESLVAPLIGVYLFPDIGFSKKDDEDISGNMVLLYVNNNDLGYFNKEDSDFDDEE